jgi:formiminotetrahydrofolate cyclodeaminase
MSKLVNRPLLELLTEFASAGPTPGGGSASALAAAVGLSLVAMVARMPRTRHGTEVDRQTLDGVLLAVEHLAEHAVDLVDEDAAAYEAVIAGYRHPKATENERAQRKQAIEAALRGAAEVPLEVMRTCRAGLGAAVEAARAGNPAASSDVGVAVELLGAALRGAALNVRVNLASISEQGYVDAVRDEVARLEHDAGTLGSDVKAALSSA